MTGKDQMHIVRLIDTDSPGIDVVRTASLDHVAGALCLGGAPKTYGTARTNEDAILLAKRTTVALGALADAHDDPCASHAALEWVATQRAARWTSSPLAPKRWPKAARDAFHGINTALCELNRNRRPPSKTTLVLILSDPAQCRAFIASTGDSHAFLLSANSTRAVAVAPNAGSFFLGARACTLREIGDNCAFETVCTDDLLAAVLASDGLSTAGIGFPNPCAEIHATFEVMRNKHPEAIPPITLAERIVRAGCAAQKRNASGDNISVVVLDLHPPAPVRSLS